MSDDRPILRPATELSDDFKAIGTAIGQAVRNLPSVKADTQEPGKTRPTISFRKSRPVLSVHARNQSNG